MKSVLYDNQPVFYRVYGEGRPVMLVHGFGVTSAYWDHHAEALSRFVKVIVPDLPGSGASPQNNDLSMEGLAEALHAIVHAENIDRCTMIGHSMGGYITLAFAEKYYNHIDRIGLFHSTSYPDSAEKKEVRRRGIGLIREYGAFEFLKTVTPNLFSAGFKEQHPDYVKNYIETLRGFTPEALIAYYEGMMARPDRTHILKESTEPVLFVIGETDQAVSPADMLKQSQIPEKSYIHLFRHSAHMGMLEETGLTTTILTEFAVRD